MKYKYINKVSSKYSFLNYPQTTVTLDKVYNVFIDFEVPNTLFFIGDNGITYKLIESYFEKI